MLPSETPTEEKIMSTRTDEQIHEIVRDRYGAGRLVGRICAIYDRVHPVPR